MPKPWPLFDRPISSGSAWSQAIVDLFALKLCVVNNGVSSRDAVKVNLSRVKFPRQKSMPQAA